MVSSCDIAKKNVSWFALEEESVFFLFGEVKMSLGTEAKLLHTGRGCLSWYQGSYSFMTITLNLKGPFPMCLNLLCQFYMLCLSY